MGCGCGKGMKGVIRNRIPTMGPNRTQPRLIQNQPTIQSQSTPTTSQNLTSSDRTEERKRREAILRKLGRL